MTKDQSILQAIALTLAQVFVLLAVSPVNRRSDQQGEGAAPVSARSQHLSTLCGSRQTVPQSSLSSPRRLRGSSRRLPTLSLPRTVTAGLLVPIFASQMPLNFAGNIIAFVYLLALGTFFLILAGLDAGSLIRRDGKQP